MDSYIVCDGMGEYVIFYNPVGLVMVFGSDREAAHKTTDAFDACEIARIAREVYKRRYMRIQNA